MNADPPDTKKQCQLRPPLKWAGGKRWLVPRLNELYRPHGHVRLVEPFVGGLAVALGLLPEAALLVDINPHAINYYRWLQRGLVITHSLNNQPEDYNQARDRFNDLISTGLHESQEAAELFYYLNRTGFNGLCRFNQRGKFNVPFGRYKTIQYVRDFRPYSSLLSPWQFACLDFEQIALEPTDFVYADPPYDVEFRQYSSGGFSWQDQVRLAEWLSRHKGPVVASNQGTERILRLYESLGFRTELYSAPRRISCNGDRTPATEMVATKNVATSHEIRVFGASPANRDRARKLHQTV